MRCHNPVSPVPDLLARATETHQSIPLLVLFCRSETQYSRFWNAVPRADERSFGDRLVAQSNWYLFDLFNPARQTRYFVIAPINEGGFGQVWSGVTEPGLPVAIKITKPTLDAAADLARWFNEQRLYLECLHHDHIVTTYDQFCSQDGRLVIVMETANGSLHDLIVAGRQFDAKTVCQVGVQILSALHYIHTRKVIHRDVTPQNILWFMGGTYKLADFGISKADVGIDELARTFVGHKTFVPPELLAAGYTSYQSDIYQLGLVLLALLTGNYPIAMDASVAETRQMILAGKPRLLAESLVPQHGQLAQILSFMLRRRDAWRYKTALDVWRDLSGEFERQEKLSGMANWFMNQIPVSST